MSYGKPCKETKCKMNHENICVNSTFENETEVIPCGGEFN